MNHTPDTYFDLFLGYSAIWIIIACYLWRLNRRQSQMSRELEELQAKLKNG